MDQKTQIELEATAFRRLLAQELPVVSCDI